MNFDFFAFDSLHHLGESATHPLIRLVVRLPLSLFVAPQGDSDPLRAKKARVESYASPSLSPHRFAAVSGVVSALALMNPASALRGHPPKRTIGRVQLPFLGLFRPVLDIAF